MGTERAAIGTARNANIDLLKILAACSVIFIHVGIPGIAGDIMNCLARFAVPSFFAISGYFSYNSGDKKIFSRTKHIFKLALIANALYFIWNCYSVHEIELKSVKAYIADKFSPESIARWIFMERGPFSSHLWYLSSMIVIYLIIWAYVRFFSGKGGINYKPLYVFSATAFLFQIILGLKTQAFDMQEPYELYRNSLFFGLPMFSLGMFIHEHRERIMAAYKFSVKKALAVIIIGLLLSLLQWFGIGKTEMPVAMIFVVVSCLLLIVSMPPTYLNFHKMGNNFLGNISLVIYIIHPMIKSMIAALAKSFTLFEAIRSNGWLYIGCILLASAVIAIIFCVLLELFKGITRNKKERGQKNGFS